jgi:hypothetical protein
MSWPFSNVVAPNADTDFVNAIGTVLHDAPNILQTSTFWMLGIWATNRTGSQQTLTLANKAGVVFAVFTVADGFSGPLAEGVFKPSLGLQIQASVSSANFGAQVWGYQ